MTKGPQGPRTKGEILNRMITLALEEPRLINKEIQVTLEKEFPVKDVPCLRTIQQYVKNFREQAEKNVQEQPWALGTMGKAGIPWEAAQFLIDVLWCFSSFSDFFSEKIQGFPIWPWTGCFLHKDWAKLERYLPDESFEEFATGLVKGGLPEVHVAEVKNSHAKQQTSIVITNRQAKWLWRMHLMLPDWTLPDWLPELCILADRYAHREMLADYLGRDFSTRDLDLLVITVKHTGLNRGEIFDFCKIVTRAFYPLDKAADDKLPLAVKWHLKHQEILIKKTEKEET